MRRSQPKSRSPRGTRARFVERAPTGQDIQGASEDVRDTAEDGDGRDDQVNDAAATRVMVSNFGSIDDDVGAGAKHTRCRRTPWLR